MRPWVQRVLHRLDSLLQWLAGPFLCFPQPHLASLHLDRMLLRLLLLLLPSLLWSRQRPLLRGLSLAHDRGRRVRARQAPWEALCGFVQSISSLSSLPSTLSLVECLMDCPDHEYWARSSQRVVITSMYDFKYKGWNKRQTYWQAAADGLVRKLQKLSQFC